MSFRNTFIKVTAALDHIKILFRKSPEGSKVSLLIILHTEFVCNIGAIIKIPGPERILILHKIKKPDHLVYAYPWSKGYSLRPFQHQVSPVLPAFFPDLIEDVFMKLKAVYIFISYIQIRTAAAEQSVSLYMSLYVSRQLKDASRIYK